MNRARAGALVVGVALASTSGCKRGDADRADGGTAKIVRLDTSGLPAEVREGVAVALAATAEDERGNKTAAPDVAWSVTPADAARVEAAQLTAVRDGPIVVVASWGALRAEKKIVVQSVLAGRWERTTEPYKGLRVTFRSTSSGMEAVVVDPAAPSEERIAAQAKSGSAARAAAELECQRSLWAKGDRVLSDVRRAASGANASPVFDGTMIVRDWGLVSGRCRHADSSARAHMTFTAAGDLSVDVARRGVAKPATQAWRRVAN